MAALVFLIRTLVGLYITVLLLRLLFQLVRADFYNPVSQAIVKLTTPLVIPLRRFVPSIGRVDTASFLLALGFQALMVYVIFLLRNFPTPVLDIILWSVLGLLRRILDIFTIALIIIVVLSWVAPHSRSPVALLAFQLTEPLLKPVRGKIPPIAGLDFSVMIILLALYMIANFVIPAAPF
jgi:YggT family protein